MFTGIVIDIGELIAVKPRAEGLRRLKIACTYDRAGFKLPNEVLDGVDTLLGSASMDDALDLLQAVSKKQGILLFTASGENWHLAKNKFEDFLSQNQSK